MLWWKWVGFRQHVEDRRANTSQINRRDITSFIVLQHFYVNVTDLIPNSPHHHRCRRLRRPPQPLRLLHPPLPLPQSPLTRPLQNKKNYLNITVTLIFSQLSRNQTFTFFVLIVDAVSLALGVGGLAVVDVVAVQVGELGEQLEDGLPVVGQVCHLAVKQVETLQLGQLFLEGQRRTSDQFSENIFKELMKKYKVLPSFGYSTRCASLLWTEYWRPTALVHYYVTTSWNCIMDTWDQHIYCIPTCQYKDNRAADCRPCWLLL